MSAAGGAVARPAELTARGADRRAPMNPLVVAGLILLTPLAVAAGFAPAIAPHSPTEQFWGGPGRQRHARGAVPVVPPGGR